jgi:hypothetical protein
MLFVESHFGVNSQSTRNAQGISPMPLVGPKRIPMTVEQMLLRAQKSHAELQHLFWLLTRASTDLRGPILPSVGRKCCAAAFPEAVARRVAQKFGGEKVGFVR